MSKLEPASNKTDLSARQKDPAQHRRRPVINDASVNTVIRTRIILFRYLAHTCYSVKERQNGVGGGLMNIYADANAIT